MGFPNPERILIHAPYGRDGAVIAQVLQRAGIIAEVCPNVTGLCTELNSDAGAVIIADEALRPSNLQELGHALDVQESWSDLPVIVLTNKGEATEWSRQRFRSLRPLGNVILLERPLRTETAISASETALRARRRQYEVRNLLKSLREANAELTAANKELEEFAYVASHDLQEPLRMVNIYTQMIMRKVGTGLDGETRKCAGFVHNGVRRMEMLLRDLLRFSRVVHGESPTQDALCLEDALRESLSVLRNRIEESGATVVNHGLPQLACDRAQYSQVFENLVSNALKYRKPDERPHIDISSHKSGTHWVIAVEDNGIGFEQKYSDKIFGLFKRLHRDEYPGTGIGLAICKRIVERQGGKIWVESEPDRGSKFYFTVTDSKAA